MLSPKQVFDDLDFIDRLHRSYLTPEQRVEKDRQRRREDLKSGACAVVFSAAFVSVTILPWVIGIWSLGSWIARKAG